MYQSAFQVYEMVSSVSKSIIVHQVYQGSKVIKKYQMYIKCIQRVLGISKNIKCIMCILSVLDISNNNKNICDTLHIVCVGWTLFLSYSQIINLCSIDLIIITCFAFFFFFL